MRCLLMINAACSFLSVGKLEIAKSITKVFEGANEEEKAIAEGATWKLWKLNVLRALKNDKAQRRRQLKII